MREARIRAMTWSLVALGVAAIALGGVLLATFPGSEKAGFAHLWAQGQAQGQTQGQGAPQAAPQGGSYPYGWFMRGPRFFGGGLVIALIVILVVTLVARRWGGWRYGRPDGWLDAEEILRRTFAEGRITEEEYKRRLSALRK